MHYKLGLLLGLLFLARFDTPKVQKNQRFRVLDCLFWSVSFWRKNQLDCLMDCLMDCLFLVFFVRFRVSRVFKTQTTTQINVMDIVFWYVSFFRKNQLDIVMDIVLDIVFWDFLERYAPPNDTK